jgi:hypothetical protein
LFPTLRASAPASRFEKRKAKRENAGFISHPPSPDIISFSHNN